MARRVPRAAAVAAGTLALLLGPVVVSGVVLDRDGAGDPAPIAATSAAPPAGAPGAEGSSDIPAVPAADRPAPIGVVTPGTLPPSPPVSLAIPAIGVAGDLEQLGVGADGALAPPADARQAGWFAGGVEPGQAGPAVIAGHVDSRNGPAVFYRLGDLVAGDRIAVGRADGSTVTFTVTAVRAYPKARFPTDAVYGPIAGAGLRLITCTGVFDDRSGHYRSNLVVYATLAAPA